jgi:uncharacterized protein (TIGR02266 family)
MAERRESRRVTVELWVEESHGRELYFQRASNLSIGGLFLEGTLPHPPGTVVRLRFTLPGDSTPIETRGEIVNVPGEEGRGMGLHFVELSPSDRERIDRFIAAA